MGQQRTDRRASGVWRSRWAAIGAATVVTLGAGGGFGLARATSPAGATAYVPLAPCRLFDTRPAPNTVGPRSTPLGEGQTMTVTARGISGNCTVPASATAITINLTAAPWATANTFLTMWPSGGGRPNASNLNVKAGDVAATPNLATVTLSADGKFDLYNAFGQVNVIGDVLGYYTDHTHDDRYYTKEQVDQLTAGASGFDRLTPQQLAQQQWWLDPGRTATFPVGSQPSAAAFDGTHLWVANRGDNTVKMLDRTTGAVLAATQLAAPATALAFDGTRMWAGDADGSIHSFDVANGDELGGTTIGIGVRGLAFDGTFLWATLDGGQVKKIDPATLQSTTYLVGSRPTGIAFDGTRIWVADNNDNKVFRIEPATGAVTGFTVPGQPVGLAFDGTDVWVARVGSSEITRIPADDPAAMVSYPVRAMTVAIAYDGTSLWVTYWGDDIGVAKVNPVTGAVLTTYPTGGEPTAVVFDGTSIWVTSSVDGTITRYVNE